MANAIAALGDIHEASQRMTEATDAAAANGGGAGAGAGPEDSSGTDSPPPSAKPNAHLFIIDSATLSKLLVALNECSEWGRIALLNTLATYRAVDTEESEHICERVMPQFQHNNAAVVLGAVKVGVVGGVGEERTGW